MSAQAQGWRFFGPVMAFIGLFVPGCNGGVEFSLDDKRCSATGGCLPGYVCSTDHLCVRPGRAGSPDAGTAIPSSTVPVPTGVPPAPTLTHPDSSVRPGPDSGAPPAPPVTEVPPISCPSGLAPCGSHCVDLTRDNDHCGACGALCAPTENGSPVCRSGKCATACDPAFSACGATCTNLGADPKHCGSCDRACPVGQVCAAGECKSECQPGSTECGGSCVDVQTDRAHCGACTTACTDPALGKSVCVKGACKTECDTGFLACAGVCTDTNRDPQSCGACGKKCDVPAFAVPVCAGGTCDFVCRAGFMRCGSACVETNTDPKHCGGCGVRCGAKGGVLAGQMHQHVPARDRGMRVFVREPPGKFRELWAMRKRLPGTPQRRIRLLERRLRD